MAKPSAMSIARLLAKISVLFCIGCTTLSAPSGGVPIRVAAEPGSTKVVEVPLERYVTGVLAGELYQDWPIEALKAQAVAARTYALYRKKNPRSDGVDLFADQNDQVFSKRTEHSPEVIEAVKETTGEVLVQNGEPFQAFFHSCCGGVIERADRVWPGLDSPPPTTTHKDPFCENCPSRHWDLEIERSELTELMEKGGISLDSDWSLEVAERDESGRVVRLLFRSSSGKNEISGTDFRRLVGNGRLKSTLFEVTELGESLIFSGKGFGHGVGLCQWGAKGMAEQGNNYRKILEFYYPGSELIIR